MHLVNQFNEFYRSPADCHSFSFLLKVAFLKLLICSLIEFHTFAPMYLMLNFPYLDLTCGRQNDSFNSHVRPNYRMQ